MRIVTVAGVCVMGLIAVLCIGVGGFVWNLLSKPQYIPDGGSLVESIPPDGDEGLNGELQNFEEDYKNAQTLAQIPLRKNGSGITNYLLLGYDGNSNRGVRSDTNIILSVNDRKKTIKLISLLRDTYVSLPGRDSNKDGKDDWGKLTRPTRTAATICSSGDPGQFPAGNHPIRGGQFQELADRHRRHGRPGYRADQGGDEPGAGKRVEGGTQ